MNQYYGFYKHHVVACINAGYLENAASWIERDYGENYTNAEDMPYYPSLKIIDGNVYYNTIEESMHGVDGSFI